MIGAFAPHKVTEPTTYSDDPVLAEAWDVAQEDHPEEFLIYPEPWIIRERYLSGQYPHSIDEAENSFQ